MTQPRPLRRDAADNRQRLIEAAYNVFERDGLTAGVGEIAAEAGVGIGTLYRHFGAKDALIDALIDLFVADVEAVTLSAAQIPDGKGLERYFQGLGEALVTHRACLSRVWESPRVKRLEELRPMVEVMLSDAQLHGRMRLELTPADMAVLTWSLRAVISSTVSIAPEAWRRHLEVLVAGYRPGRPLVHPPLGAEELAAAEEHRRHRAG